MRKINNRSSFALTVDYNLTFERMADLSNCSLRKGVNENLFPIIGSGRRIFNLTMVDFFDLSPLGESLGTNGCFFGQIEHAFAFAAAYPEKHYEHSFIFPGSIWIDGQRRRFCPLLTSLAGGRDIVQFDLSNPLSVYHQVAVLSVGGRFFSL